MIFPIDFLVETPTLVRVSSFDEAGHKLENFKLATVELSFEHDMVAFQEETEFKFLSRLPLFVFEKPRSYSKDKQCKPR